MKLYGYYRSSSSYRVRIALNLKNIECEFIYLDLRKGEHQQHTYTSINPQGFVPALEVDGKLLTQSMAIIEYLDTSFPGPALLPKDEFEKARVRAAANIITCDIQPLDNLRVLNYLKSEMNQVQEGVDEWYRHWIMEGFTALEALVEKNTSCCFGDTPGLVDLTLVPQMYNARRFNTDLSAFPRLRDIDDYLLSLPAFDKAVPENQEDAS